MIDLLEMMEEKTCDTILLLSPIDSLCKWESSWGSKSIQ